MRTRTALFRLTIALICATVCNGMPLRAADMSADYKSDAAAWIDTNHDMIVNAARAIHSYAETALMEHRSATYLADLLDGGGFQVERGVADMPTAFVASWGSGSPVVGILAEYDALPGLSQKPAMTVQESDTPDAPGHGCGHNLYGPGSIAAAMALKSVMEQHGIPGTVKLFGCPAEETVIGKVYMAKAGVFDGLDACFAWHPAGSNEVSLGSSRAMNNFEVTFSGKTAHGSADPWNGRSALDAVELMNTGVNYLREHVKDPVRIHYVIKDGGRAPNIVPERATAWYYVRDIDRAGVDETYARVLKCAEGAALMTETTMEVRLVTGVYNYLPNRVLSKVLHDNLAALGAPVFTDEEQSFARGIQKTLGVDEKGLSTNIEPLEEPEGVSGGSTDIADVSWIVPTAGELRIATNPAGSPGHSWVVTSSSCSPAGFRGMLLAAKVLALSSIDVLTDPAIITEAKTEFAERTEGFTYQSAVPENQRPPLP